MVQAKWLKIDTAFPNPQSEFLENLLKSGWKIKDKTTTNDRYVNYLLVHEENIKNEYCEECKCYCSCHPCKHTELLTPNTQ